MNVSESKAVNVSESKVVVVLEQTPQNIWLQTVIRNKDTSRRDFKEALTRLARLVIECGLNLLPMEPWSVVTPTGEIFHGKRPTGKIFGAVILRAALSMNDALGQVCPDIRMAHLLIQRDEQTSAPIHTYTKAPPDAADRYCLLLDPMLATGGSAKVAIKALLDIGVKEERIIFFNIICAPEGIAAVNASYPKVMIVTAAIDNGLNEKNYIIPGLGDAGDRFFGTD